VPGRRAEVVAALIRSLPKQVRRHLVPAAEHAAAFLRGASPDDGPLGELLARYLSRQVGVEVGAVDFDLDRLPPHLLVTFEVDDDAGLPVATGKHLGALQAQLADSVRDAISEATGGLERTGLRTWDVGDVPRMVEVERSGQTVRGYPALVDDGDTVALRVLSSRAEQHRAHWRGVRRLLRLAVPSSTKALSRQLGRDATLALTYAPHDSTRDLIDDCTTCALDTLMAAHGAPVWDEDGFDQLRAAVQAELPGTLLDVVETVARVLQSARRIEQRVDELASPGLLDALTDARVQLARLVFAGFVTASGADRLGHIERYLRAIERRLDVLRANPARDAERMRRVQQLWARYQPVARTPAGPEIRWMIEELRVSVFAQSLGTAHPVSEKRILDAIAAAS
jgi:ATP-dependent helicase HrpA